MVRRACAQLVGCYRLWHSPHMNPKRLVVAIFAVFAGVWVMDFLIHGVWLKSAYSETMSLWRPEIEMQARMGWLMLGQFLAAAAFVVLWAKGFAATNCIRCACLYGMLMGLFSQATTSSPTPCNRCRRAWR